MMLRDHRNSEKRFSSGQVRVLLLMTTSIIAGCYGRSGTSRRRSCTWGTIPNKRRRPLRPDSNETVSGEAGAIRNTV